jgi:hypothetical protein
VCNCRVTEPGVLVVGVTNWSGEGVRSQVSEGGVQSYGSLTPVTVAILSLLQSQGEGTRGSKKELQCSVAAMSRRTLPSVGVH